MYKDVSESLTYLKFRSLQDKRGLYTSPSLLAGSLDTGTRFVTSGHSEPLAQKKFDNFKEFSQIYPEFSYIFIGDNGQGDVRAAELMMSDPNYARSLSRTYIHVVQNLEKTYVKSEEFKSFHNNKNVCYFTTYIDAAVDAYKKELIRASGLHKIILEAINDFEMISQDAWMFADSEENVASVPQSTPKSTTNKDSGLTSTFFGSKVTLPAKVSSSPVEQVPNSTTKESSDILSIDSSKASASTSISIAAKRESIKYDRPRSTASAGSVVNALMPSSILQSRALSLTGSSTPVNPSLPYQLKWSIMTDWEIPCGRPAVMRGIPLSNRITGLTKRELRLRELNNAISKANKIMAHIENLKQVPLMEFPQMYELGKKVKTQFGIGKLESFRASDGIYEVAIGGVITGTIPNGKNTIQTTATAVTSDAALPLIKVYIAGMNIVACS